MKKKLATLINYGIKTVLGKIKLLFNLEARLNMPDRQILEQKILPYLGKQDDLQTILFVGTEWYTKHYWKKYFTGKDFRTIDFDSRKARYGSDKHIVCALEDINQHFSPNTFNLIIINGVIGWGIDSPERLELAFERCDTCLKEKGILVLGYNDVPEKVPFPFEDSKIFGRYSPFTVPVLGKHKYRTNGYLKHTFQFFMK